MNRDDERIDLSPLDPETDPDRLNRVVEGVLARLGPGLVPDERTVVGEVAGFLARRGRVICAAAVLAIAVASATHRVERGRPDAGAAPLGAHDLPGDWSAWLFSGEAPSPEDLLFSLPTEVNGR